MNTTILQKKGYKVDLSSLNITVKFVVFLNCRLHFLYFSLHSFRQVFRLFECFANKDASVEIYVMLLTRF